MEIVDNKLLMLKEFENKKVKVFKTEYMGEHTPSRVDTYIGTIVKVQNADYDTAVIMKDVKYVPGKETWRGQGGSIPSALVAPYKTPLLYLNDFKAGGSCRRLMRFLIQKETLDEALYFIGFGKRYVGKSRKIEEEQELWTDVKSKATDHGSILHADTIRDQLGRNNMYFIVVEASDKTYKGLFRHLKELKI